MPYIESLFNEAMQVIANERASTVDAVKMCYDLDLYDMMSRVKAVYTELYEAA